MSPGNLFILESKGQMSRSREHKTLRAWVKSLLWVLAFLVLLVSVRFADCSAVCQSAIIRNILRIQFLPTTKTV